MKNANGETFDFCYRLYSVYGFLTNQGQLVAVQLVTLVLAERTRFELAVGLPLRQFSKLLVSATHPPLQCFVLNCFIKRVQRYGFFCYFQKKSVFFDEIFFEAEAGRCQAMLHVWGACTAGGILPCAALLLYLECNKATTARKMMQRVFITLTLVLVAVATAAAAGWGGNDPNGTLTVRA